MKDMRLICTDQSLTLTPEQSAEVCRSARAWLADTVGRGVNRAGGELQPASCTTCLKVRDGRSMVTDGPFTETKEQVAGLDIVECATLGEAIEVASRHPVDRYGTIDMRRVEDGETRRIAWGGSAIETLRAGQNGSGHDAAG